VQALQEKLMNTTRTLLMLLALVLPLSAQAGDIYRYKDAAGNWQYSDKPVPGAQRVGPLVRSTPASASNDAKADTVADKPLADKASAAGNGKVSGKVQQDIAKLRAEDCKKATEAYEQSISYGRLYKPGANGEPDFLDAEQIDAYRAAAHTDMDRLCGNTRTGAR
jgi:hypothetical protein